MKSAVKNTTTAATPEADPAPAPACEEPPVLSKRSKKPAVLKSPPPSVAAAAAAAAAATTAQAAGAADAPAVVIKKRSKSPKASAARSDKVAKSKGDTSAPPTPVTPLTPKKRKRAASPSEGRPASASQPQPQPLSTRSRSSTAPSSTPHHVPPQSEPFLLAVEPSFEPVTVPEPLSGGNHIVHEQEVGNVGLAPIAEVVDAVPDTGDNGDVIDPDDVVTRPMPPEDSDDGSGDALDTDSSSAATDAAAAVDGVEGGVAGAAAATPGTLPADDAAATERGRRSGRHTGVPAVPVTSLAGKRHTKVVMIPGGHNGSNNITAGGGGGGGMAGPSAGAAAASGGGSRRAAGGAAASASAGAAAASASTGGNSHHHGEGTLRYRTDLDKQVIHFMFERYQHELTHPTASLPCGSGTVSAPAATAAAATTTTTGAAVAPAQPNRLRRMNVEEIVVPANGEGEDKNIGLGDWHFFWMHVGRVRHTICSSDFRWQDQQIINHFPDHAELTRKDLMYKNIKRYLRDNQGNNYARLTLHTATDWVSAATNVIDPEAGAAAAAALAAATAAAAAAAASGSGSSAFSTSAGALRGRGLRVKSFCFADSVPLTFNIPNDMSMFKEEFQKRRGTQWIVKPTSRSQGKGIFLIDDVRSLQKWVREKKESENMASFLSTGPASRAMWVAPSVLQQQRAALLSSMEAASTSGTYPSGSPTSPGLTGAGSAGVGGGGGGGALFSPTSPVPTTAASSMAITGGGANALGSYIVSRYVSNPLLIGGKKFDLRLYVLVTSYKPLVAYLHEDGFARFCATRYAGNSLAQEDLGSHLTNVALQKGDEHYNTSHGGKWSFQNLFLYVQGRYGPYAAEGMMKNIQFLIYHSLKAVEPVIINDKHSYELYGYDILIDDHINPHLIEVNASPSMSTTTVSDRLLKEQVLTDTMKIIFPPGYPTHNKGMPYWEYRQRTDLTTQQQTGFKLLQF